METDKEENLRRMHRELFRIIGENLPPTSPDFERFKQEIPLGLSAKKRCSTTAEKLLEAWEVRGGISLGEYDNLFDLFERSGLLTVRLLAEKQIDQILQNYQVLSSDHESADEQEGKCVGEKGKKRKRIPDQETPCTSTTETSHVGGRDLGEVMQSLDRMYQTLAEIKEQQNYIYMSVLTLSNSTPTSQTSAEGWISKTFPIKTVKGMEQFELSLSANDELRAKLIEHLVTIRAENITQETRNNLTRVITKNLASKWHVSGKWKIEHKTFKKSPLYQIIFDAVKQNHPDATEKGFRDVANKWFRSCERTCTEKQTEKSKNKGN